MRSGEGARLQRGAHVSAQILGEYLEGLRCRAAGELTPAFVVEDARRPRSPLHSLFEWDDGEVLDPFGGSGSTLIACEKAGRQARLIELDPKYVDVIVRRWQDWSGELATLYGDGRSFEEIAAGRSALPGSVISDQRPSLGGSSISSASPVSP